LKALIQHSFNGIDKGVHMHIRGPVNMNQENIAGIGLNLDDNTFDSIDIYSYF